MPDRETFRLTVEALPDGVPAAVRLRRLLKFALRQCRLRCTDAGPAPDPQAWFGWARRGGVWERVCCGATQGLAAEQLRGEPGGESGVVLRKGDTPGG